MCSPIFTIASSLLGTASAIHSFKQEKRRAEETASVNEQRKRKERAKLEQANTNYQNKKRKELALLNLRTAKSGLLPMGSVEISRRGILENLPSNSFSGTDSKYSTASNPWKIGQTILSNWSKLMNN